MEGGAPSRPGYFLGMAAHAPSTETPLSFLTRSAGRTRPLASPTSPQMLPGRQRCSVELLRLVTAHCYYRAGRRVTRIPLVAWIGLNDHHLWNVTRDRWTRLCYRTGHNDRYVRWNRAWWCRAITWVSCPCAAASRWIRVRGACKAFKIGGRGATA
jgi:hypothetical protein